VSRRLLALGALGVIGIVLATPASAQQDRARIDTTFALSPSGTVQLGVVSGEIRVRAGSDARVRIVASTERGRFETTLRPDRVAIEARPVSGRMGETRIEVTVPVGVRVRATSISGDISVEGTRGSVEATTVSGRVLVTEAAGTSKVGVISGDIDVQQASGRLEVSTVSGRVRLDGVTGDLTLEGVSADMLVRDARVRSLRATAVSGDIRYEGALDPTGVYRFGAHSGSLTLVLPANGAMIVELETFSGRITSDFPVTLPPGDRDHRHGSRTQFTIGDGGARLVAETFSGNIIIRRASARGTPE
jgi:DUF4097 and DUF4098 domain-containing protein YvlB